jgi:hypothetical protein
MFATVNLAMTGWMEQSEIVEPVRATFHFPDHVMGVPFGLQCDEVTADQTPAILSLPEYPSLSIDGFLHAALVAPLELQFPSSIERIGFGFDLDVPRDRDTTEFE